jgi:Exopolyphosphatase-related proteins
MVVGFILSCGSTLFCKCKIKLLATQYFLIFCERIKIWNSLEELKTVSYLCRHMKTLFFPDQISSFHTMLKTERKWVLMSHINPDGDAIGALRGIGAFLEAQGREVKMILPNSYPDFLAFLDADGKILIHKSQPEACKMAVQEADAICCLDMSDISRLEGLSPFVTAASCPKVLIDHHPNPLIEDFDLVFSAPALSSSCELVYRLICELGMDCPAAAAEPLYTGLMTDTNNFANSVAPESFEVAAALQRLGVDKERIQQQVFGAFSEGRLRLMAHSVLQRMVVLKAYAAAYIIVSMQDQAQYHFEPGDTEGFVNIPLTIKGVNVSVLFVETPWHIRVSLRSRNGVEVHEMARTFFNGGGHKQASGGKLYKPISQVPALFLEALQQTISPKTL